MPSDTKVTFILTLWWYAHSPKRKTKQLSPQASGRLGILWHHVKLAKSLGITGVLENNSLLLISATICLLSFSRLMPENLEVTLAQHQPKKRPEAKTTRRCFCDLIFFFIYLILLFSYFLIPWHLDSSLFNIENWATHGNGPAHIASNSVF